MARVSGSSGVSESSIVFYNGGHNHDGISSSLIDTDEYSLYDWTVGYVGAGSRLSRQEANFDALKNVIANVVTETVLGPTGIRLAPNSLHAISIVSNTITADQLAANIVLVNNIIRSNNYVAGVSGWAIGGDGSAEFANTSIRGALVANSVTTPGVDILANGTLVANSYVLYGNGAIVTSNGNFSVDVDGYLYANGASLQGNIVAVDGYIGSWSITPTDIFNNTGVSNTVLSANGYITAGTLKIGNNDISDAEDIVATNIIRGGQYELSTMAGVLYTTTAASAGTANYGWSFYYTGTNVYARLYNTANGTYFDICIQNCGTGTTSAPGTTTTAAPGTTTTSAPGTTTTAAPGTTTSTVSPTEAPGCGPSDNCGPTQSGAMGTVGCGPYGIPIYFTCCNDCGTECIDILLFCI